MTVRVGRKAAAIAGVAAFSLVLTACGSDDDADSDAGTTGDAAAAPDVEGIDCSLFEQFGDLSGTQVSTYAGILAAEAEAYERSWVPFEECTGVDVKAEWSNEFEAQVVVRVQSGNAPDVALLPQPGLLNTLVADTGAVLPVFEETTALVEENFDPYWKELGTVDGTFYGFPNSSNSKSFVWYSPSAFAENNYEVPTTWEEMIALSDQIAADNPDGITKPWCAGIGSGAATGWPVTDWVEDTMLREHGVDVYDQWVNHDIPFNDPQVEQAFDKVDSILRNPDYVNGGVGDVVTIASTAFGDGGLTILDGTCFMHRQGSFYATFWPEGTNIGEDGDVFTFYLPANEGSDESPVLVGSEMISTFEDRPEVRAFTTFLATSDYANLRAKEGEGFVSANLGLDVANIESPVSKQAAEQFQDPNAVLRFDASDLMPGAVGSGSFWTESTAWIAEGKSTTDVLDAIEASWP